MAQWYIVQRDDVLLFVTDAVPYNNMVKVANAIKAFFSKIIHITCLAHELHRISEKIRSLFPKVDDLAVNMQKYFCKPLHVLNCWKKSSWCSSTSFANYYTLETWSEAAMYNCEYFKPILKYVVQQLSAEDAISIEKVKN